MLINSHSTLSRSFSGSLLSLSWMAYWVCAHASPPSAAFLNQCAPVSWSRATPSPLCRQIDRQIALRFGVALVGAAIGGLDIGVHVSVPGRVRGSVSAAARIATGSANQFTAAI